MTTIYRFLRHHLHFISIVPLLIIAVTWPVFPNMFDASTFWLPSIDKDVFMKFWDAWYGKVLLRGQADFHFTDLHFHPTGLSLVFHNFSLPHMFIFGMLQLVMPADAAYSLTHLLTVFANVLSAYVVLLAWFRNKWVALSGAIVFGMHPYLIHHTPHPEVIFLATIPLSLYALHRGIVDRRNVWLVVAALLLGISVFIGMYVFVCLLILLGIYTLWLASTYWRNLWFWRYMALVFSLAAAISLLRVYPMLANQQALGEALDKGNRDLRSEDILEYVVNLRHPHMGPVLSTAFDGFNLPKHGGHTYFGLTFFAVAAFALISSRRRRQLYPWVAALLFFAIMQLGDKLVINGQSYGDILLPRYYLARWLPWLFRGFWDVEHYMIGILFPSAVLFAYGLEQISVRISLPRRPFALLAIILLLFYERAIGPVEGVTIPEERIEFINWLATEPNQDDIHIINLPMGRTESKLYGFFQTFNAYPQVEGLAARTPEAAYDYIEDNSLLRAWRQLIPTYCLPRANGDFQQDLKRLQADGFTHIVLHHDLEDLNSLPRTFDKAAPAYIDDTVTIYRLDDMHSACDSTALLNPGPPHDLPELLDISLETPDQSLAVLSLHSFDLAKGKLLDYYSDLNPTSGRLIPLGAEDLLPQAATREVNPAAVLAANQMVIFIHDPRHSDRDLAAEYRRWVAQDHRSCGRLDKGDELHVELFLLFEFPCDLVTNHEFKHVDFDSGHRLGNLILQHNGDALDAFFKWNRMPGDKHSISIQFFKADGEKAYNQDFVIRRRSLSRHRIDMASLQPGDYQLKLIVYNFETQASVAGEVISSGARFERELEIGNLTVD